MGRIVAITSENVAACDDALEAMRDQLSEIIEMTNEYPVECEFAGYRFVFTCEDDVHALIKSLEDKINAFRSQAA